METIFEDRKEAGELLGERLASLADRQDVVVLALPRGGVPVAYEVARRLRAPLDVVIVRKLGVPGQEEYAMGAIASGGWRVINEDAIQIMGITRRAMEDATAREEAELQRREQLYRSDRPFPSIRGKTVVLIDDGIATGSTMRAAARAIRSLEPARLMIAVPTAPRSVHKEFAGEADEVIALITPVPFRAVGNWYGHFPQTSDEEVSRLLAENAAAHSRH